MACGETMPHDAESFRTAIRTETRRDTESHLMTDGKTRRHTEGLV